MAPTSRCLPLGRGWSPATAALWLLTMCLPCARYVCTFERVAARGHWDIGRVARRGRGQGLALSSVQGAYLTQPPTGPRLVLGHCCILAADHVPSMRPMHEAQHQV